MRSPLDSTYAVILAGGRGTRFWPLSRRDRPKQFLRLASAESMLQATADRVAPLVPRERMLVVTAREHVHLVREHLPDLPERNILAEPVGKNTAAAIAWAAEVAVERDPGAVLLVLSADHHVANPDVFRTAARRAIDAADTHRALVLFGLQPNGPRTQYGYIVPDARADENEPALYRVARFHEKPPADMARAYLAAGPCFWNSGMFCWRADVVREEIASRAGDVYDGVREALRVRRGRSSRDDAFPRAWEAIRAVSIDHALLEHSDRALVVASGIERIDLGTWETVAAIWPKDGEGNVRRGDVFAVDIANTITYAEKTLIVAAGVENLVIVATDRVVLVCDRSRAADVNRIVEALDDRGYTDRA